MAQVSYMLVLFVTLSFFASLSLGQETLSRHCLENPPILITNYGAGSVKQIGGLKAYVSDHSHSNLAIILISDVYGYEAPHLRNIADKIAQAGFYSVVPDFFYGDPYVVNSSRTIPEWLKTHGTDKGFEDAKTFISALKKKAYMQLEQEGFAGEVVVQLAKTDFTKATVLLHPSWVTLDDIKAVKVPISILAAELDNGTPPALLKQFEDALSKHKVKNFIKIFPKVKHGWTVRYNESDVTTVEAAKEAHKDMLLWLSKYLKKN